MRFKTLAFALAAAGLLAHLPPAAAQRATTDALGTLPGGNYSSAQALNNSGQVAGNALTGSGYYHAFLWSSSGGMQDLGTLGGNYSNAYALNNSGQVAGYSYTNSGYYHAFLWSSGGGVMQDLGTLGGTASVAYALNNSGQVAGNALTGSGYTHAFLRSSGGGMQDLGTLGGNYSNAYALNNSGQVAGYSYTNSGYYHAFLWSSGGGVMQDLGTLGGSTSYAYALNNSGQVAGYSTITGNFYSHAFLWSSGGGMQDLGTLPGGNYSNAFALNNSGQVAGYSDGRAFLWNAGTMYDLNSLGLAPAGWTFGDARGINDLAQVAGSGNHNGQGEDFRLTLHPDWQGGNGSWSSAANWNFAGMGSFGITPGAPHDVVINPAASATVSGPLNATVNSLAISGNGGNLVTLNLNYGSVTAANGTTLGNNGVVTGYGRLAGDLAIQSGGRVKVQNSEQMQLAGSV